MPSFPVLTLWHTYAHSHHNSGSKRTCYRLRNSHNLLEILLFKFNLQGKGYFYGNCLFNILNFDPRSSIFQLLHCGICMHIPILTMVQKGRIGN